MATGARGPGRPAKITPKGTAGRKRELMKLKRELWKRLPDASDRDAAAIAARLQAVIGELSSYDPEPEDETEKWLANLKARGEARRAAKAEAET